MEIIKHFGDITKLSGYKLPHVDCICGGSPCQDLSVAGLRKGLEGERSGLFMEQIRITKEMRERARRDGRADDPGRYLVWENVPGAFSSNGGKDFQAVLTEIVRIAEPNAPDVPLPEKGKWPKAGCLYDELANWSVVWRTHDSQWWGVPQRRKRISVLADFSGLTAPEIMFDPQYRRTAEDGKPIETFSDIGAGTGQQVQPLSKGLPRDSEQGGEERKETTGSTGDGSTHAISFQERAGKPGGGKGILIQNEHTGALSTLNNQSVFCIQGAGVTSQNSQGSGINEDISFTVNALDRHAVAYGFKPRQGSKAHGIGHEEEKAPTLNTAGDVTSLILNDQGGSVMSVSEELVGALRAEEHGQQPIVFDGSRRHDYEPLGDVCETVQAHYGTGGGNTPIVVEPTMIEMTSTKNTVVEDGISPTLTARMGTGGNQVNAVCMSMETYHCTSEEEKVQTLKARDYKDPQIVTAVDCRNSTEGPVSGTLQNTSFKNLNSNSVCRQDNVVRRLTPLECERLQGYPDGWTDIGEWTDSKGKKHKDADSPRYKALGNSIALPFWFWLLRRISAQYERPATLGSLFDGIGGFPLCWERCNGKGTAIWASEIEEFPIAVTKLRFPEEKEEP